MRVFCTGLFVAALAAALPQIAAAQRPGQGQPGGRPEGGRFVNPIVAALDTDKDGTISAEELKNAVASLKTLDKDGDGKLSAEELRPSFGGGGGTGFGGAVNPEQMVARILEQSDKNGDGKLSKEETPDRMKERFDTLDANKDGSLDKEELKAMAGRFGGRPGARPEGGARPGAAPRRPDAERP